MRFNCAFLCTCSCHEKWVSVAYSLFVWDSRNIRGLRYVMLEFISGIFLWRNTSYLKCKYSIFLKNVRHLINCFFKNFLILCCFSNWSHQKRIIFVLQRDESEE